MGQNGDNMKKFCITTLTHNASDRKRLLTETIKYFTSNTSYESLDWFILVNGSTENWKTLETKLISEYPNINFTFEHSDINLGVGAGINKLNSLTEDYEYTLFLEGDWYCVPEHLSFINSEWLNTSLEYLDSNKDISQIVLRKYLDDTDDRMYGYGYFIVKENVIKIDKLNDVEFIRLVKREYTNNPHIRRNKDYYDNDIFPLDEFYDDDGTPTETSKNNPDWGQAEIKAEPKGFNINAVYIKFGKFIHGDGYHFELNEIVPTGCGNCKYGLMAPKKFWCYSCIDDGDFTQFTQHQQFFERDILPAYNRSEDEAKAVARTYHTAESEHVFDERENNYMLTEEALNDEENFKAYREIN